MEVSDRAGKWKQPWCAKVKTRNFKWDIQCYSSTSQRHNNTFAAIPVQARGTVLCLLLLQSMPVAQYHVWCYSSTRLSNNNVFAASPIYAHGTIPGLLLFHYKPLAQYHVCCYSSTRLWYITRFATITAQTPGTILSSCSSKWHKSLTFYTPNTPLCIIIYKLVFPHHVPTIIFKMCNSEMRSDWFALNLLSVDRINSK